jgi:enoyl-[acyl-carrier-protein] reductase (NADH)
MSLADAAVNSIARSEVKSQAFMVGLYPQRRLATAEEMAKSVLYLACDMSSFTTGSALLVDGGVSINRT